MAISATHYAILRHIKPILPQGGSLLEIGEANWYGDLDPKSCGLEPDEDFFVIAKRCYQQLFAPKRIVSIDANGTPQAMRCDLNHPLPPLGQFDVVMNHGTAEHVFNIAQVFASIHAACKVGGLMIHDAPFYGWPDHGFYCLQPTLFYDLAAANGYEIAGMYIHEIKSGAIREVKSRDEMVTITREGLPMNAMLFVVLRKTSAAEFEIPWQGYYSQSLSEAGTEAWRELR